MKPELLKVAKVLMIHGRFVVPLYQRQYQWHDHKRYGGRTSAFWLDVATKATEVLEEKKEKEKSAHYMGALLLASEARGSSMISVKHVVDGQQRLTTFLILLAAMREVSREHRCTELIEKIEKYLFNEPVPDLDDPDHYKLTPTSVDREVFFDILKKTHAEVRTQYNKCYRGGKVPQSTSVRALRAYEYFKAQIEEFVVSGASDDTEIDIDDGAKAETIMSDASEESASLRLNALLDALVWHLKLIVIWLGEDDDAQVIFETLNSKAQPLLAMDLVRNNIFHRAEAQHRGKADARKQAERLYCEVWEPFDAGWWRENAPNARPARPRIDHFLANVLTAETGERIPVRDLYAEYRDWATPNRQPRFENVEDELAVLRRHVPTYETLEKRRDGDKAITWLGERLRLWQNTTAYPIAFQIAAGRVDTEARWAIAKLIDSYLVRRTVCHLGSKGLNQLFPRLAAVLHDKGVAVATVQGFFDGLTSDTTRFPNDGEFRSAILEKQAYSCIPSHILSDLLWSLELASRTSMTEATDRPNALWIEHIMPQTWKENWPLNGKTVEPGNQDELGSEGREREAALHTLGNLTVTSGDLNRSMGNDAFRDKVTKLFKHSNLTLNRHIAEHEKWDESTIRQRGEVLATLAIKVWPLPTSLYPVPGDASPLRLVKLSDRKCKTDT